MLEKTDKIILPIDHVVSQDLEKNKFEIKNIVKGGYLIKTGDIIRINDLSIDSSVKPENIPLDILYEDKFVIVVNKPSNLLTVATEKEKDRTLYICV